MNKVAAYKHLHKRFANRNVIKPMSNIEDIQAWQEMKLGRGFTSFEALPQKVQDRCLRIKEVARNMAANAQVYLIGSWINGDWVDEQTPEELREVRYKIKKRKENSDIDVVIHSDPYISPSELKEKLDFPVDLTFFNPKTTPHIVIP